MTYRKHETEAEKLDRRLRYNKLRKAGIDPRRALIFRDWTDNKIDLICQGIANPIR